MMSLLHILSSAELSFEEYTEILNKANEKLKAILQQHNCNEVAQHIQVLSDDVINDIKRKVNELDQLNAINQSLLEALLAAIPDSASALTQQLKERLMNAYKEYVNAQNKLLDDKVYFRSSENPTLAPSRTAYLLRAVYKVIGLYSLTLELFSKLLNNLPVSIREAFINSNTEQILAFLQQLKDNLKVIKEYHNEVINQLQILDKLEANYETIRRQHLEVVKNYLEPMISSAKEAVNELNAQLDNLYNLLAQILGGDSVKDFPTYLERLINIVDILQHSYTNIWDNYVTPLSELLDYVDYLESTIATSIVDCISRDLYATKDDFYISEHKRKIMYILSYLVNVRRDYLRALNKAVGFNIENYLRQRFFKLLAVNLILLHQLKETTTLRELNSDILQLNINSITGILNLHGQLLIKLSKLQELIGKILPLLKEIKDNPSVYATALNSLGLPSDLIIGLNKVVEVLPDTIEHVYSIASSDKINSYRNLLRAVKSLLQFSKQLKDIVTGKLRDSKLIEPIIVLAAASTIDPLYMDDYTDLELDMQEEYSENEQLYNNLHVNIFNSLQYWQQLLPLWLFVMVYYPLLKDIKAHLAEFTDYLDRIANDENEYAREVIAFGDQLNLRSEIKAVKAALNGIVDELQKQYPSTEDILELPGDINRARGLLKNLLNKLKETLQLAQDVFCETCGLSKTASRVANIMQDYKRYRNEPYLLYLMQQLDPKLGLDKFITRVQQKFNVNCEQLKSLDIASELQLNYNFSDFYVHQLPYVQKVIELYANTLELATSNDINKAKQIIRVITQKINKLRNLENLKDNWDTESEQITTKLELIDSARDIVILLQQRVSTASMMFPYLLHAGELQQTLDRIAARLIQLHSIVNSCVQDSPSPLKDIPSLNFDSAISYAIVTYLPVIALQYDNVYAEYYKFSSLDYTLVQKALNNAFSNLIRNIQTIVTSVEQIGDVLDFQQLEQLKNNFDDTTILDYLNDLHYVINTTTEQLVYIGDLIDDNNLIAIVENIYNPSGEEYTIYELLNLLAELKSMQKDFLDLQKELNDIIVETDAKQIQLQVQTISSNFLALQDKLASLLYTGKLLEEIADYYEFLAPDISSYQFIKFPSEIHNLMAKLVSITSEIKKLAAV